MFVWLTDSIVHMWLIVSRLLYYRFNTCIILICLLVQQHCPAHNRWALLYVLRLHIRGCNLGNFTPERGMWMCHVSNESGFMLRWVQVSNVAAFWHYGTIIKFALNTSGWLQDHFAVRDEKRERQTGKGTETVMEGWEQRSERETDGVQSLMDPTHPWWFWQMAQRQGEMAVIRTQTVWHGTHQWPGFLMGTSGLKKESSEPSGKGSAPVTEHWTKTAASWRQFEVRQKKRSQILIE